MNKPKKIIRIVLVILAAVVIWFAMIIADCRSTFPQGKPIFAFIMTEYGEFEIYHGLGCSFRLLRTDFGTVYYIELKIFGQTVLDYDSVEYLHGRNR